MSRFVLSSTAFVLSLGVMAVSLAASYPLLPPNVAAHFNAVGQPDAWTSRANHLLMMSIVGLGLPMVMAGVFWAVRYLPVAVINLPNREYWLAPERRNESSRAILELGLWFVVLQNLLFVIVHWLVVAANRQAPVQLSASVWPVLIVYLLLVAAWLWCLWRRFRLPRMNGKDGLVKHQSPYSPSR